MNVRTDLWQQPPTQVAVAGAEAFRLAPTVHDGLVAKGVNLVHQPLRQNGNVADAVAQSDVLVTGMASVDDTVAGKLRNVRFVLRPYVGYDDIDVDALTSHGILFANVPDAFIEEVANQTLALMLACNRKIVPTDAFIKRGDWSGGAPNRTASAPIRRLSSLTLGLVGFGNIGRLVLQRARAFGFRVMAADPYVAPEVFGEYGVEPAPLERVLADSDIVSLHVLLNRETRHLIGAPQLALMKPDAVLINTSRGPVVDEAALVEALQAGRLAGAGLDVFEVEPLPTDSPLRSMPNVVLSSHIASYSQEGDVAHNLRTLDILSRVLAGGLPERKVVVNKDLYDALAAELGLTEGSPPGDRSQGRR